MSSLSTELNGLRGRDGLIGGWLKRLCDDCSGDLQKSRPLVHRGRRPSEQTPGGYPPLYIRDFHDAKGTARIPSVCGDSPALNADSSLRLNRTIVYIDALNLYHGMIDADLRRHLRLDVAELARKIATVRRWLSATKYYVARFSPRVGSYRFELQNKHLQALPAQGEVEIIEGAFQSRQEQCNCCDATWEKPEEKMTDVNLSIDLICDAEDDRYDTAIIVSADGDLTGPVRRVLERHPSKAVVIAVPPRRWSRSLVEAASAHFKIGRSKLRGSQLPDRVVAADGRVIARAE